MPLSPDVLARLDVVCWRYSYMPLTVLHNVIMLKHTVLDHSAGHTVLMHCACIHCRLVKGTPLMSIAAARCCQ